MFAAVDLGSNSFRFHVGVVDGGLMQIVKSGREPVRLAAGLDAKGNLSAAAMDAALACLIEFRAVLASLPLQAVRVVATNTLRVARNAAEFLPRAEAAIGYPIEVISGEEEGRLIYMGVSSALPSNTERCLVVDIGGGSTEVVLGAGAVIRHVESFSTGTQPMAASFFSDGRISDAAFEAAILSARSYFEDAAPDYQKQYWNKAYGSSGTMRAMAKAIGEGELSLASLQGLKAKLIAAGSIDKVAIPGLKPERVVAVLGGLSILLGLMQELGFKSLHTINAGLRMGVLWDLQLRATKQDRREISVLDFMLRFHVDTDRAARVARIACMLFQQLKAEPDGYAKYLYWSGLLHESGLSVSHTDAHKHGAYLIEHADMPGFTTREQCLMSTLVLAQKGNLRKVQSSLDDPDFARAVLALRLAAIFMHAKVDADMDRIELKTGKRIELTLSETWLNAHPTVSYMLEREREHWREVNVPLQLRIA